MFTTGRCRGIAFVLFVSAGLAPSTATAHPGSGIVVDRLGQVYFVDMVAGVWKIDTHGALTRIPGNGFHWMSLDANARFAAATLPSGNAGDIVRLATMPTLLLSSDYPIAMGGDGNLYYPSHDGRTPIEILRFTPSGQRVTVTSLPATSAGVPLRDINGIAVGRDGALYVTDNASIRRISRAGVLSTVVEHVAIAGCASPLLRGLDVDAGDTIYVAATACGRVLKVVPRGEVTVLAAASGTWAPTGVAVFGRTVYVLEFEHPDTDDRREMLPRVRQITPDGKSVVIATVTSH